MLSPKTSCTYYDYELSSKSSCRWQNPSMCRVLVDMCSISCLLFALSHVKQLKEFLTHSNTLCGILISQITIISKFREINFSTHKNSEHWFHVIFQIFHMRGNFCIFHTVKHSLITSIAKIWVSWSVSLVNFSVH